MALFLHGRSFGVAITLFPPRTTVIPFGKIRVLVAEPRSMLDDRIRQLAELLHQAGEVHHVYYADVDGNDDDWASFYSTWLLQRTNFPKMFARRPVRSGLTRDLVVFDEEFQGAQSGGLWQEWYAQRLIEKYG